MSSEQQAGRPDIKVIAQQETEIREPSLYHVVLLNDDFTTMEFVVEAVQRVFFRTPAEATRIMLEVHNKGRGVAGTYVHDIARTKAERVMQMAFKKNYPLKCILEKA